MKYFPFSSFRISYICPVFDSATWFRQIRKQTNVKQNVKIDLSRILELLQFAKSISYMSVLQRSILMGKNWSRRNLSVIRLLLTQRFSCVGCVQWANFIGPITKTGIVGRLIEVKHLRYPYPFSHTHPCKKSLRSSLKGCQNLKNRWVRSRIHVHLNYFAPSIRWSLPTFGSRLEVKNKPDFHSTIASRRQNFRQQNKRNESKQEIFVPDQRNCRIWWLFTKQVLVKGFWVIANYVWTFLSATIEMRGSKPYSHNFSPVATVTSRIKNHFVINRDAQFLKNNNSPRLNPANRSLICETLLWQHFSHAACTKRRN